MIKKDYRQLVINIVSQELGIPPDQIRDDTVVDEVTVYKVSNALAEAMGKKDNFSVLKRMTVGELST